MTLTPTTMELADRFRQLGIDPAHPGFCDEDPFLRAEAREPRLLQMYGAYVLSLAHSPEYLQRARTVIRRAAHFLRDRLVEDGRRGACVDVTHTLARFLNRQGIWNVAFNGGLAVHFDRRLRLTPTRFQPIGAPNGRAGHVWLLAPPFRVVDITIHLQPYVRGEAAHVPPFVLAESLHPAAVRTEDLVDADALEAMIAVNGRAPTLSELSRVVPGLLEDLRTFPAGKHVEGQSELVYAPWQVSGMTGNLEEMRNLCLRGKYPIELYKEFEAALVAGAALPT